jgi:UDPglucose--hexose-1-phosphate uridylyltransferase
MKNDLFSEYSHRRFNTLTGEWVLVSPHRSKRPWQGQVEKNNPAQRPAYDPTCYLCPDNIRAGGNKNPDYKNTFVFTNDFSALLEDSPLQKTNEKDIFITENQSGICRVMCFSPPS